MIHIPEYAKKAAREALEQRKSLPEYKRYGLDKSEARRLGINSGVERAKQIVRSKTLPIEDAKRVAAFYQRFKNCNTPKCEGSHKLWGGRRFERSVVAYLKKFD